jgi:hypothetical protein
MTDIGKDATHQNRLNSPVGKHLPSLNFTTCKFQPAMVYAFADPTATYVQARVEQETFASPSRQDREPCQRPGLYICFNSLLLRSIEIHN